MSLNENLSYLAPIASENFTKFVSCIMRTYGATGNYFVVTSNSFPEFSSIVFFYKRFVCDNCYKRRGTKRLEHKYTAKRLPTTRLGNYIETRVNNFLRKKEADSGEVYIRVVFSGDKHVEVKGGMKRRYLYSLAI